MRAVALAAACLLGGLCLTVPARSGADEAREPTLERLVEQREAVTREIEALRRQLARLAADAEAAEPLRADLVVLERIDNLILRQQSLLERREQMARTEAAIQAKLAAGPASDVSDTPPYPLALLDLLGDALDGMERQGEVLEQAEAAAATSLETARQQREAADQARRRRLEAQDKAPDLVAKAQARRALRQAELELRLADERVALATLELESAHRDRTLHDQNQAITRAALEFVEERLQRDAALREELLGGFEQQIFAVRQARERASLDLARAQERRLAAEKRKDSSPDPSPALLAENAALEAQQETQQIEVATLGQREERLEKLRDVRERRYRTLADEASRPEMREWAADLQRLRGELERRRQVEEGALGQVRAARASLAKRAAAVPAADPQRRWLEEHERALDERLATHEGEIADLRSARSLVDRTLEEIQRRTEGMTLADRAEMLSRRLEGVWQTEITSLEDRPITVGKVVTALVLLIVGLLLARFVSALFGRIARRRTTLQEGAIAAFQALGYYALALLFVLLALRSASIPLTAFTILGGAFAIGVGFGSQTLIANFISGLILLVERPIKVGDLIDLEGTLGRVESIGLRSTRVRTFDNIHIIVPNSSFLEQNVVNWNLSDDIVRAQVNVGVAYGSPTRRVEELLLQAAREHPRTLDQPPATVLFMDFGDNALHFRVYAWLRVRDVIDRRLIESDLRHRIDELFRQSGVVIAFPQRDVHLDVTRPLQVEWTGERTPPGE